MNFFYQLKLLLWKNFTLRRRQPFRIVVELVWPLILFLILAWVKTRGLTENRHACHFDSKAMPSAGALPFLQGMICSANNTCHRTVTEGEMAGQVDAFNASLLARVYSDVETLLNSRTDRAEISDILEDIRTLADLQTMINNGTALGNVRVGSLLVDPEQLRQTIIRQNISISPEVLDSILNASFSLRDLVALAETARRLQDSTGVLQNLTSNPGDAGAIWNQLAPELRRNLCNESIDQQIIRFNNPEDLRNAQAQLCNLTTTDYIQLIQDFQQQLDFWRTLQEIERYTQMNQGRGINFDNSTYRRLRNILQDVSNLDSVSEFQRLLQDSAAAVGVGGNNTGNGTDSGRQVAKLLCGREEGVINIPMPSRQSDTNNTASTPMMDPQSFMNMTGNNTTDFCDRLFSSMQRSRSSRLIWRQISPFIRGKIPFYPNTPATQRIIKEANQTFEEFARLYRLIDDWLEVSPVVYDYLSTSQDVENIRNALPVLETFAPNDQVRRIAQTYSRWLYNGPKTDQYDWRDSLNLTNNLLQTLRMYLMCFDYSKYEGYDTEDEMIAHSLKYIKQNKFWAAIKFDMGSDNVTLPQHISYQIRMDVDKVDSTKRIEDRYYTPGPRRTPGIDTKYTTFGYAYIQDMVEHAIIRLHTGIANDKIGVYSQMNPYPCYIYDTFSFAISRSVPLFMVLAWIYSVAMIVKGIVYEKERRLKEVMKVMGLTNLVHWVAWFITAFIMMIASSILLVIIIKGGNVMQHTNGLVLMTFLTSFTIATISQAFLFSVFFSKANLAAACGGILYFLLYLPYTLLLRWEDYMNFSHKAASCLSSTVAFSFGCGYIARFEEQAIGVQWSNIGTSPMPDDDFNMGWCIFFMLLDAVIYMMFAWYIEAVFPGQYGMPRPWYFPVTRSYWCGHRVKDPMEGDNSYDINHVYEMDASQKASDEFENEPTNLPLGVSIRQLKKVYSRGNKTAVDGLNLNFYEGQITSFLGHNGAGKTTTMSILTGLFPPTQGTALIYDKDIRTDMDDIRQSLGMCPQHNVLFDHMSVEEHLWFYGRLKGLGKEKLQGEIDQMVKDVGLPHKRKELSRNLSGGMKRKLSVGIAFVGGSRTVILDEPTAGVDPYARRQIWELLLKYKAGRTILLSTHFMDEADILGDRIAIISQGKLQCCGSSLFLKDRYGSGYYLTVAKANPFKPVSSAASLRTLEQVKPSLEIVDEGVADMDKSSRSERSDSDPPSKNSTPPPEKSVAPCDEISLTAFIKKYVADAILVETTGTELVYQLPEEAAHRGDFEVLFESLDASLDDLGIGSYGISDTTLEEVFLRVAEDTGVDQLNDETKREELEATTDHGKYPRPVSRLSFRGKLRRSFFGEDKNKDTNTLVNGDALGNGVSEVSMGVDERIKNCNGAGSTKITGSRLILRQFMANFTKRFHNARRSKKGFVSEVILPAVFVLIAMVFAMILPPSSEEPPLELHPWLYTPRKGAPNLYTFYSNDKPGDPMADAMEKLIAAGKFGTRCMDPNVYQINGFPCRPEGSNNQWTSQPPVTGNTSVDSPDCDCSTGMQVCPAGAGGPDAAWKLLPTTDFLYNMTGRNISDWLVKTNDRYIKKRYGGFSFGDDNRMVTLNGTQLYQALNGLLTAANNGRPVLNESAAFEDLDEFIDGLEVAQNAKVWFNNKGWAASVAYMNSLNNVILRANLPPSADPDQYGITATNYPMIRTQNQMEQFSIRTSIIDVLVAISVIFAMSFIPASFVIFLIDERTSNSKHLQFVSGVNPAIYWVSTYVWDFLNYMVSATLCFFIFVAFQQKSYVGPNNWPCLICLLVLYGWSIIPMMYPFSYVFNIPSTAFVGLSCLNVFIGTTATLATFTLEMFNDEELNDINEILRQVFLVLPHYCLGRGLLDMTRNQLEADLLARYGEDSFKNPFTWNLVGRNMVCMLIQGIVFFGLTICIQYKFWCKSRPVKASDAGKENEDEDVAKESLRVANGEADNDVLKIEDLTKVYRSNRRKFTAVDKISVGVPSGECFGLLGVNGAGKTTTFKMLTGDIPVTSGNAHVNGHSILDEMTLVHQDIGYCPQFDAINSLLTGRENLEFYARLRGVPEPDVGVVAEWAIRKLGLLQYSERCAGDYSGGNKRKLSTAIALVGNPPIIFLDEPTTGMDPKARRFLWNCILQIIKDGRSVILTSHSMEECEALCNRIAIMVNGSFQCLGSIQHLKNRFGDGYMLDLRVSGDNPDMAPIVQYVLAEFPSAVIKEQHFNMVQFQLGVGATSLAKLFGTMEAARQRFSIEDYSVTQTTLDQVFINFAKNQTDLLDDEMQAAAAAKVDQLTNPQGLELMVDEQSLSGSTLNLVHPDTPQQKPKHNPRRLPPLKNQNGDVYMPNVSAC